MEPNFTSNIKIMKRKIVCFLLSYVKIFYLTQSYTRNKAKHAEFSEKRIFLIP